MDERELNRLAARVQDGEEEAFRTLVETLSRTLVAMAYRYTGDWEWARDLTQDTWVRVWRKLDRYDPRRSFSSWLYAIHRNGCRDHLRRPWVRRELAPGDEIVQDLTGPAGDDPEQDLEGREFRERILAAAAGLSDTQREIFLRVDVEREGQKDVARALGIKFGTLRTTLHFARRRVAVALRERETSP